MTTRKRRERGAHLGTATITDVGSEQPDGAVLDMDPEPLDIAPVVTADSEASAAPPRWRCPGPLVGASDHSVW